MGNIESIHFADSLKFMVGVSVSARIAAYSMYVHSPDHLIASQWIVKMKGARK